ncbi:hypothetical protein DFJ77DRAFT_25877 [Powellomyces hirtus]|nr:hypothetical protein DFJ77DRAFT_25877 [Powellomyces hirtus]
MTPKHTQSLSDDEPLARHEGALGSSSDGSDDDDANSEMDVTAPGELALFPDELKALQQQVASSPYNYESHLKYITELRRAADFQKLRDARQHMSEIFPLSEDIWLQWIEDESRLAATVEEKRAIAQLYQKAVVDYLSIKLWHSFLSYLYNEYEETSDSAPEDQWISMEAIRKISDQGLNATQLHFTEGATVWRAYRDFEALICEAAPTEQQISRLRDIYIKRLQIPHMQLDETFSEYSGFESTYDPENYESRLKAASSIVAATSKERDLREPYEKALVDSNHGLAEYQNYLSMEKSHSKGDPFRIRTLYERAVVRHCLDPTLWDAYITDIVNLFDVEIVLVPLVQRAVRNCNWVADTWSHQIRMMEHFKKPEVEVHAQFDRALTVLSPLANMEEIIKLFQSKQDYEMHQINWTEGASEADLARIERCKANIEYIHTAFPPGDPYLRLERGLLRIYTRKLKDFSAARELYVSLTKAFGKQSDLWVEYADFERLYGSTAQARAVYKTASIRATDWPERIFEAWLSFEREEGSVETYYSAVSLIKKQTHVVERRRLKELEKAEVMAPATQVMQQANQTEGETSVNGQFKKRSREADPENDASPGKRQKPEGAQVDTKAKMQEFHIVNSKVGGNMLYITNLSTSVQQQHLSDLFAKCGRIVDLYMQPNPETGALEAYVELAEVNRVRDAVSLDGTKIGGEAIRVMRCKPASTLWNFNGAEEKNKIYVSNLPVDIKKPALREIFSKYGTTVDIRLVLKNSIAFAYIEYADEESAQRSLEVDGRNIAGRKISVAISNPQKTKVKEADPKELFVSNLAFTTQPEDIEALFKEYGAVKDVRMMHNRDGQTKGTAFVEFETEDAAKKALALNGTQVDGRVIVVTVPDPNMRHGFDSSMRGRGRGRGRGAPRAGLGFSATRADVSTE